ncbi:MAG: peptide chain release factor 1, partial [Deltaproteobacteria bacterium]
MFAKLAEVEQRFLELSRQLEDPRVYSDPRRLQQLGRERKALEPVVEAWRRYRQLQQEIEEYREALRGKDAELSELAEQELPGLERQLEQVEEELKVLLLPRDPLDEKNIMLEIRAGTGGEEAALFAADMLRMYLRFAESRGWSSEIMSSSPSSSGGYKEVVVALAGEAVYSHLKYEGGV